MLSKKTYKNQITLPKEIARDFEDVDYFDIVKREGDIILHPVEIKSRSKNLEAVRDKMEAIGLTAKDVEAAVKWARGKKN